MQNWRVGNVQSVDSGDFLGSGFVLYDENGIPCVMFGYLSEGDAKSVASMSKLHLQTLRLSPALDNRIW